MNVLLLTKGIHTLHANGVQVTSVTTLTTALEQLTVSPAPDVFLLDAHTVSQNVSYYVSRIPRVSAWTPTALWVTRTELPLIGRIWPLGGAGLELVYPGPELTACLASLAAKAPPAVAQLIRARFSITDDLVLKLLSLLETDEELLTASADEIARKLCIARATLYMALARSNAPGVAEIQALFKLARATRALQQQGSADLAARVGMFSDPRSFRRSVVTHLGLTIRELRDYENGERVVDRWIQHRAASAAA